MIELQQIFDQERKRQVARAVLEALPDWFGIPEAREAYIADSAEQPFFCAVDEGRPVGFLTLRETGKDTMELAVMGVLKECHRKGVGRQLFQRAKEYAASAGYSFFQVKTVQMGKYEDYDQTNLFYRALGFKELEVFPTLWGEENPCQIYVLVL